MKRCGKCKQHKNESEFGKDKSRKDGLQRRCKACWKAYNEANKEKKKAYNEANKEKIKATEKAYREANKEKIKARQKAHREANKEKIAAQQKAYREANKEKIKARGKARYEANKEKINAYSKAYYEENKEKIKAYGKAYRRAYYKANKKKIKAYREANKEKIKARSKAHREANREKIAAQQKAYREANKENIKAYNKAYRRAKKKTDPYYKFLHGYRGRLREFFSGSKKTAPTAIALGCSAAHACRHLESQFAEGMTWDNYGTAWEVDHIFPIAKADLHDPAEFLAVCNWRNLQPLTPEENREKSDKVTPEARRLFEELCKQFASKADEGVLRRREAPVSKESKKAALTTNLAAH